MLINDIEFISDNFTIQRIVSEIQIMISEKLNMEQQAQMNKWEVFFDHKIDREDNLSIYFGDLQDLYESYIKPLVEHFSLDLKFDFLLEPVTQDLTESQIIVVLRYLNERKMTSNDHVVLNRLRVKYLKAKQNLSLALLFPEEKSLLQILELLDMKNPVRVNNSEFEDLTDFVEIYSDGHFSSKGFRIYFNPDKKLMVKEYWSMWQGEEDRYSYFSFEKYLNLLYHGDHPNRAIEGLKHLISMF